MLSDMAEVRRVIDERVNARAEPAVLICNAHITGLAVARAFGRRGIPVIAVDSQPGGFAQSSRYVALTVASPNPLDDEDGFIERLREIGAMLKQPAILSPCMDEWVLAISKHRDRLAPFYKFPYAPDTTIEAILDKSQLYKRAAELGVPVPRVYDLREVSPEEAVERLGTPCILKPVQKRAFYDEYKMNLFLAEDREQFFHFVKEAGRFDLLAQELLPTTKGCHHTAVCYMSAEGRVPGALVGRRLELYPPDFGTTALVEIVDLPELIEQSAALLRAFHYQGIAECEFMYDERDGKYKLLDLNTRPWKWIGLPIHAGVDLPYLAYTDALGCSEVSPVPQAGLRWVSTADYLRLKIGNPGTDTLSEADWLTLLAREQNPDARIIDAIYAPDDIAPEYTQIQSLINSRRYYCAC